jgi:hypothetical protein
MSGKPPGASQALMEHSPRGIRNSPSLTDEQTPNPLSALSVEERERFLRFVGARLPDGDPLKCRIHTAVEMISHNPEHSVGKALAEEVQETETAAWRAIENENEAAIRASVRLTEEFRSARVGRMEQLLIGSVDPNECRVLQDEFKDAHQQNPELYAWIYVNELPLPAGPGSLHFRELANRAAWAFARRVGDDAWKSWLDILVGYLLKNDRAEEYLFKMQVGHLERPEGTTYETHPGIMICGENYRIDHLSKASDLCCAWVRREALKQQPEFGRGYSLSATMPPEGSPSSIRTSAKNQPARMRADAEAANPLLAAMRRQDLNSPRLALLVRAELKRRGVTKFKVDRTTIYRLVNGQTRHPNLTIRSAVLAVLKLPLE